MALSAATKEAIWMNKVVKELGLSPIKPVLLYCDNRGAVNLTKNSVYHGRTKHIDIQHHFVREAVSLGHVLIENMDTSNMIADYLTKTVNKSKHEMCFRAMGLK